MANYQQFADKIGEGRVVPAYSKLLTDINYCIHVFKYLEMGRTYTEIFFDWLSGKRGKIDIERFPIALGTLKQEVELGVRLYISLTFKMKSLKDRQTFQESRQQPVTYTDRNTTRWGAQQELMFQFGELINAIDKIVIPDNTQPRNQLFTRLQEMGNYVNSDMKDRAKMYETTKILYLTLNQNEVLDVLRANHTTVKELILSIDPNADIPTIPEPLVVRQEIQEKKYNALTYILHKAIALLKNKYFILGIIAGCSTSILYFIRYLNLYLFQGELLSTVLISSVIMCIEFFVFYIYRY